MNATNVMNIINLLCVCDYITNLCTTINYDYHHERYQPAGQPGLSWACGPCAHVQVTQGSLKRRKAERKKKKKKKEKKREIVIGEMVIKRKSK